MNETTATPNTDRFRVLILVLTLLNTIFAAALAGLQVDANIRADRANRDSQYYALLAANELVRVGHQSAYDFELFTTTVKDAQQSLVMGLTALELEQDGEEESAAKLQSQSEVAQARSAKGIALSLLYTDPRYAPTEPDGIPDLEAYLADQSKTPNDLVAKQNTATDEYHRWDNKADSYIAVLSILAIAFFLLGLAQSTARMRLFFAISALGIMTLAAAWTGFIVIS
jgi:hypothetical protein